MGKGENSVTCVITSLIISHFSDVKFSIEMIVDVIGRVGNTFVLCVEQVFHTWWGKTEP